MKKKITVSIPYQTGQLLDEKEMEKEIIKLVSIPYQTGQLLDEKVGEDGEVRKSQSLIKQGNY